MPTKTDKLEAVVSPVPCTECAKPHVTVFDGFPLCGIHCARWWAEGKDAEGLLRAELKAAQGEIRTLTGEGIELAGEVERLRSAMRRHKENDSE